MLFTSSCVTQEQARLHVFRQPGLQAMMVELRHAFRKGMAEHVPQRGHQPHLGQGFRHHAMGNAPHLRYRRRRWPPPTRSPGSFRRLRKGQNARLHPKATKLLAHAVVQLAGLSSAAPPPPRRWRPRCPSRVPRSRSVAACGGRAHAEPARHRWPAGGRAPDHPQGPGSWALAFQFRLLDRAAGTSSASSALRAPCWYFTSMSAVVSSRSAERRLSFSTIRSVV